MTLDITFEPDAEEIVIVLNDEKVIKASKGYDNETILCKNFKAIEEDNEELFEALKNIVDLLFAVEG